MQANPQTQQRLNELNETIYNLNRTLENPSLSSADRAEYANQLRETEYDRSEIILGDSFPKMDIDLLSLIDRMIFEGIAGTLNWIVEKKRRKGKPIQYQEDVLWVMDIVPEGDETTGLTFEFCCAMRGMNPQNIKHCIYVMSRRKLREIRKFQARFRVIEKRSAEGKATFVDFGEDVELPVFQNDLEILHV